MSIDEKRKEERDEKGLDKVPHFQREGFRVSSLNQVPLIDIFLYWLIFRNLNVLI
jgi:hypothetical protein